MNLCTREVRRFARAGFAKNSTEVFHNTPALWIAGSYQRHSLFHTFPADFRHEGHGLIEMVRLAALSTKSTGTAHRTESFTGNIGGVSMISDPSEAAIDRIVATCNGDLRGALRALLLVNEQLEAELQQFYAAAARTNWPAAAECCTKRRSAHPPSLGGRTVLHTDFRIELRATVDGRAPQLGVVPRRRR